MSGAVDARTALELADWRRRVAALYAEVRALSRSDPELAWRQWVEIRQELFRSHPQSPVPVRDRPTFRARHFPYDPAVRFEAVRFEAVRFEAVRFEAARAVEPGIDRAPAIDVAHATGNAPVAESGAPGFIGRGEGSPLLALGGIVALPNSGSEALAFHRIGELAIPFDDGQRWLAAFWMEGYAGGLFLPFRDRTSGAETYGAGRYLIDSAKSADLGGDVEAGTLVLDFNFAFQPSCAFDPRWACPLAPPENRLDRAIRAGERIA